MLFLIKQVQMGGSSSSSSSWQMGEVPLSCNKPTIREKSEKSPGNLLLSAFHHHHNHHHRHHLHHQPPSLITRLSFCIGTELPKTPKTPLLETSLRHPSEPLHPQGSPWNHHHYILLDQCLEALFNMIKWGIFICFGPIFILYGLGLT